MARSANCSSVVYSQSPLIGGSTLQSPLGMLHVATSAPVMRSKAPSGFPGYPDVSAMRERCKQGQMTLGELQRRRGVEPPDNPHADMLEAYGYRQLAELVMGMPSMGLKALDAVGRALSFRIGPPGAEAAPVGGAKASAGGKNPVAAFQEKHKKDFEIWVSPAAENAADMKGMIIVIGEHHHDPAIKAIVKHVLLGFRRTRGDRFFLEGGIHLSCRERESAYLMESGDCRLLEKDCAAFWRLKELADLTDQALLKCIAYLKKHVASAQEPLNAQNSFAYVEFMKRHEPGLPSLAIQGYQALKSDAYKADIRSGQEALRLRPERDAHMVRGVLDQMTGTALNYVIVGSDHLKDVRAHLKDQRCIFMVPRRIVKEEPSASLYADTKDEL